jgi:branched-chain amino acid transport system permease protein
MTRAVEVAVARGRLPVERDVIGIGVLGAVLLAVPLLTGPFYTRLIAAGVLYGLAAVGFNVLFGYTGLLSFGHAMFWGLGAYGVAIGLVKLSWGFAESFLLALLMVLAAALVTGYLSLRHTRIYFAMLTLAFGQMMYALFLKARDWTGGDEGLYGLPRPLGSVDRYYYIAVSVSLLLLFAVWRLLKTPLGLAFQAIRDNPQRAEVCGYPVSRVRLASYVISGLITGVAGALYAPLVGAVTPESLYWTFSAAIVFMAVLGGTRIYLGPFVGGLLYVLISNYAMDLTEYWLLAMGVMLAAIVYAFPDGVVGTLLKLVGGGSSGSRARG